MSAVHSYPCQGARLIYTKYLRQWLLKYQPKIDVVVQKVGASCDICFWHL